uniref:F-box domain-containing protein n=1 Tax=Chenopodium quinoa TaxID=63459 RepID=A0A803NDF9_CHEQI
MGFNMVPYSRLMTKRSKVKKRSSTLVVSKRRKELKSRGENEAEADLELKLELFSSMIDELLTEIFLRLPIDSVCRFKLVCKHWCSLLSSDYFVSRFTEYNHNQQCPFTLVFQYSVFGPSGKCGNIESYWSHF